MSVDSIRVRIVGDPRTHVAYRGSLVWAALRNLPPGARRWVGRLQYERIGE